MSYPNLDTLCRLCLTKDAGKINIFEKKDDVPREQQISVPMRIMACLAMEVHVSDALPKVICKDCRYQLEKTFVFRKRAQIAESKLRKHIRLLNAGRVSNVFIKREDDDEDEMEIENSVEFIKEQDKEEEEEKAKPLQEMQEAHAKELEKLRKTLETKFAKELKERLSAMEKEYELKIREECMIRAKEELHEQLKEECLQIEKKNLIKDLEIFLQERRERTSSSRNKYKETSQMKSFKRNCSLNTSEQASWSKRTRNGMSTNKNTDNDATAEQVVHSTYEVQKQTEDDNYVLLDSDSNNYNAEFIDNDEENYEIEDHDAEQYSVANDNNNPDLAVYQIKENGDIQTITKDEEEGVLYLNMSEEADQEQEDAESLEFQNIKEIEKEESTTLFLSANSDDISNICGYTKLLLKKDVVSSDQDNSDAVVYGTSTDTPKTFKCELCPIVFSTENALNRHYKTHARLEKKGLVYKCPECQVCFSCRSALNRHVVIHTGARPYKCDECGKSFVQREILKRHQKVHTGERPHKCPHCPRAYTQKVNLQQHINHNHSKVPKLQQHTCHLCPKRFNHASGLSRHLTTHSGITYQCIRCDRKFGDRSSVKRHLLAVHLVKASKFIKEWDENTVEDKHSTENIEV